MPDQRTFTDSIFGQDLKESIEKAVKKLQAVNKPKPYVVYLHRSMFDLAVKHLGLREYNGEMIDSDGTIYRMYEHPTFSEEEGS
jgi:hypothetical protein